MSKPDPTLLPTVIELCAEAWPRCFSIYAPRRKPLKIGIRADILALTGDAIEPQLLSAALRHYVNNIHYVGALTAPNAVRVDLAGNPAGTVTDDEREHARAQFAALLAKDKQRHPNTADHSPSSGKPDAGPRRVSGQGRISNEERHSLSHGPEPPSMSAS
jgi:ProP effector